MTITYLTKRQCLAKLSRSQRLAFLRLYGRAMTWSDFVAESRRFQPERRDDHFLEISTKTST